MESERNSLIEITEREFSASIGAFSVLYVFLPSPTYLSLYRASVRKRTTKRGEKSISIVRIKFLI